MSFSRQSCPSRMRSGHGVVVRIIQRPDRSGFPSRVRGVGAVRLGLPSGRRGTPGVLMVIHWAATECGAAPIRRADNRPAVALRRTLIDISRAMSYGADYSDRMAANPQVLPGA